LLELIEILVGSGLALSQQGSAGARLRKFGLAEAKGKATPVTAGLSLRASSWQRVQQGGTRSLMYLSNCTRPDWCHATNTLAHHIAAPTDEDWAAATWLAQPAWASHNASR